MDSSNEQDRKGERNIQSYKRFFAITLMQVDCTARRHCIRGCAGGLCRFALFTLPASMFAVIIFVSCNIDGLLLLMVLLCTSNLPAKSVWLGQFLSQSLLILISVALARMALHISPAYISLAGLLPITLGVRKLFERHSHRSEEPVDQPNRTNKPYRAVGSTTVLALSNGGDNLSVYVPIFTARPLVVVFSMSIVFLAMTVVWCAIASYLARHRWIGVPVRRYSQTLLPWNMIALGAYVLSGSAQHLLSLQSA